MILAIFFLLICTGVKGFDEDVPRFFTNGHGGFQFYHAQEKYEKPHKHRTSTTTTTTEIPQEAIVETTMKTIPTTMRTMPTSIRTIPTTTRIISTTVDVVSSGPTTVSSESSSTTAANVRRIVGGNLRRRRPTTTVKTSANSEDVETTTRFTNFMRRRPTTVKTQTSGNLLENSVKDEEENTIKALDLVNSINSSSVTESGVDFGSKFNRFYKKERTTTEENNEILDISTENVKKFTPKIYTSHFKLRRPTIRTTTEKTNPKIKRHDVHVLNANTVLEKRRKIYQGYIRKPPTSTKNSQFISNKIPATINRKSMPKIQISNRNFTVTTKTNSTLNKDLYSRRPSEKYMQLRQKEKPKVEAGISALRKRHLSSLNYFRQHVLKFS